MHFTSVERDGTVLKFDAHAALNDDEHFIGMAVIVPNEFALNFDQFELVIVHFSNHLW